MFLMQNQRFVKTGSGRQARGKLNHRAFHAACTISRGLLRGDVTSKNVALVIPHVASANQPVEIALQQPGRDGLLVWRVPVWTVEPFGLMGQWRRVCGERDGWVLTAAGATRQVPQNVGRRLGDPEHCEL